MRDLPNLQRRNNATRSKRSSHRRLELHLQYKRPSRPENCLGGLHDNLHDSAASMPPWVGVPSVQVLQLHVCGEKLQFGLSYAWQR